MASSSSSALSPAAAAYDLQHRMSEFLDLHMLFPLLQHAAQLKTVYRAEDVQQAQRELLDFTRLPSSASSSASSKEELAELEKQAAPVVALSKNEAAIAELRANKRLTAQAVDGCSASALDAFFRLGKLQYELGQYAEAACVLGLFRELTQTSPALAERSFDALWGKLAAEIAQLVVQNGGGGANKPEVAAAALQDVRELSKLLEARDSQNMPASSFASSSSSNQRQPQQQVLQRTGAGVNHLEQLQFRRWLLHWSLFVFFFQDSKYGLVDFMLGDAAALNRAKTQQQQQQQQQQASSSSASASASSSAGVSQEHLRNRNVLENHCPWLLRYAVAAHLVNKSRKSSQTKDLVLLVEQEAHLYTDPLCELFLVLSSQFDLERAVVLLKRCDQLFQVDFFLARWRNDLLANIRALIMEMHCKLSSEADVAQLCQLKLGGTAEEAELFAQDFAVKAKAPQSAKLEAPAKLVMSAAHVPVWQVCGDRVKDLLARSALVEGGLVALQNAAATATATATEAQ